LEAIRQAVEAGCQLIQVRERELNAIELQSFVEQVIEIARPAGTLVFVNDRVDVAIAAGADGVHLRATSLRPSVVRERFGAELLIGASVHSVDEVERSADADFLVLGPVFETESKLAFGRPLGLEVLKQGVAATSIPLLAIGGINLGNFGTVLECGVAGVAAIGMFTNPETVAANVKAILGTRPSGPHIGALKE
jgi:thiamine-phosphate pyrophosphorylase